MTINYEYDVFGCGLYEDLYRMAGEEFRFKLALLNSFGQRFELCRMVCQYFPEPKSMDCRSRNYWIEYQLNQLKEEPL